MKYLQGKDLSLMSFMSEEYIARKIKFLTWDP